MTTSGMAITACAPSELIAIGSSALSASTGCVTRGEMAEPELGAFLTDLARASNVSASTQNQALSALLFLYKEVLKQEIGWLQNVERAKKPVRLPVVLNRDEVNKVFAHLHGMHSTVLPSSA
jgi:site-specific recombinase XerD